MGTQLISSVDYKKAVGELNRGQKTLAKQPSEVRVVKTFGVTCKALEGGEGENAPLEFIASTADVDREGDTLLVDGWRVDNFMKSGSFLWAHDRALPPIGKPVGIWKEKDALRVAIEFVPYGYDHPLGKDFAQTIRRMYVEGYLRGVSVGFLPFAGSVNEEREAEGMWFPIDYTDQELVELSGTGVPANPNAGFPPGMKAAQEAGINIEPLMKWASVMSKSDNALWVSKETAAKMLGTKTGDASGVDPAIEEEAEEELLEALPEEAQYADAVAAAKEAECVVVNKLCALCSIISKQGRVLSESGETKLREAVEMIERVLSPLDTDRSVRNSSRPKPAAKKVVQTETVMTRGELKAMVTETFAKEFSKLTGRLPE